MEALAERKPKKLFGKKKPQLTVVQPETMEAVPSIIEPIDLFSQSLKQEILLQDNKIEAVLKSDNISQFRGPRVLDWNKSTGRVALAESVIKNSEADFVAFRRQMEMMVDRDGCGGRNEMGGGIEIGGIQPAKVLDFGQAKLSKFLGKNNEGTSLCEHQKKATECEECKSHKH